MEVTGVLDIIKDTVITMTGLTPEFVDDVDRRFQSLSYCLQEGEDWVIQFIIQSVSNTIKNQCNTNRIPKGLYTVAINMVCGEYLMTQKTLGRLSNEQEQAIIKSIEEGDTKITYADEKAKSEVFHTFVKSLCTGYEKEFARYRRLSW